LETTSKYLAASDHKSLKTREQVNNTFAFVSVAARVEPSKAPETHQVLALEGISWRFPILPPSAINLAI
jgi:hypothetical protein